MEELPEAYQRAILPAKRTMLWDAPDVELPTCDPSGADLVEWVLEPPDLWGSKEASSLHTSDHPSMEPRGEAMKHGQVEVSAQWKNSPRHPTLRRAGVDP